MLPSRSVWSGMLLATSVALAASWSSLSFAQDAAPAAPAAAPDAAAPAPAAPAAPAPDAAASAPAAPDAAAAPAAAAQPAATSLQQLADDFLHYALVYNEPMVKDTGQAILNLNPAPRDLVAAFEAVSKERDIPATLRRLKRQDAVRDIATKLESQLEEGYRQNARDPVRIQAEIDRLADGPRAYYAAKARLTEAGQFAVPFYIDYLNNSKKKDLQPYILQVMIEIGRPVLNPLLEQLNTPDAAEKLGLVDVIGRIGYGEAVPYLKAISESTKDNPDLKHAADRAIALIDKQNVTGQISASDAFVQLARGFYEKQPSTTAAYPNEATNPVWYYDRGLNNVSNVPIPTPIWSDIMTKRACEQALKMKGDNQQAISVWIAADLRREIDLPAGVTDPTRKDTDPNAAFYAKAAGPLYLNPILSLAMDDRSAPLALKTLSALEDTAGTPMMVDPMHGGAPLVRALSYPDRAVRFSASDALARANPAKDYPGSFRVVPVLAEAISQNGKPSVLIVDAAEGNRIAESFRDKLDYTVFQANSMVEALAAAHKAASFDLVVLADGADVARFAELSQTDYRFTFTPVLVLTDPTMVGQAARHYANDSRIKVVATGIDDAGIKAAVDDIKNTLGGAPLDATAATTYATTALKLLSSLAGDHASIYRVEDAAVILRDGLKDKRPEIATGAAGVLGQLPEAENQQAVAAAAVLTDNDPAVRQACFVAVADSAKRFGNDLDAATVDKIISTVSTETDANIRQSAAQALGALNLSNNQASVLILKQSK